MEMTRVEKEELRVACNNYKGPKLNPKLKRFINQYGIVFVHNKGKAYFEKNGQRLHVAATPGRGRANKNLASQLMHLIEGRPI